MLGVIVAAVGRQSETYIEHHIERLLPTKTVVCSLSPCNAPRWRPTAPVNHLYHSDIRAFGFLRRFIAASSTATSQRLDLALLAAWLRANDVKVVLCEYLQNAVLVYNTCRSLGIPVVAHAHGYDVSALPRDAQWVKWYRTILPVIDDLVVVSEAMRRRVLQFGIATERVHVIPCGTTVEEELDANACEAGRRATLVAVGRLIGKKGPIYLLEAFRQVRALIPNTDLWIAGDGPFREPMLQFVRGAKLSESVHFLGDIPNKDVRRLLRKADVFLQHSVTGEDGDEEGLPVSILEAMAESVPVVSTRHAGIPEVVIDGENGFLVEPGDCEQMAERTIRLLSDSQARIRMGAEGRRKVIERFSIEVALNQLRSILLRHWPGGLDVSRLSDRSPPPSTPQVT